MDSVLGRLAKSKRYPFNSSGLSVILDKEAPEGNAVNYM